MRGTRRSRIGKVSEGRFIPAHAGNASWTTCPTPWKPVHPRACGERKNAMTLLMVETGSSPRMRGTRVEAHDDPIGNRFIPAHAGNAAPLIFPHRRRTVHPRACGERSSTQVIEVSLVLPCQTTLPLFLLYGISPGLPKIFTPCSLLSSSSGVA